jgi:methionyl-tRNA formyltransferase
LADGSDVRIEFLTQDDPLYVLPFFDEFIRNYATEFPIVQISSSPTMGKRSSSRILRELKDLYGVVGIGRLLARACKSRLLGKFPKKKDANHYHTLEQITAAYGIPYQRIGNPNTTEFAESVRLRAPDLLISVACPFILKETILTVPRLGAINIHHAPLPRYKGMMPTFWQMYHGEKSVGLTIHYMGLNVDEGDALFQGMQTINPGESLDRLIQRSKRHGAHCMVQVLREIQIGASSRIVLDHVKGSYFTFPTSEESREFRRRGLRAI